MDEYLATPQNQEQTGVLLVLNARMRSTASIVVARAIATHLGAGLATLSVVGRTNRLEVSRRRLNRRLSEAGVAPDAIPTDVCRGTLGPAVSHASEQLGASLIVIGLGSGSPLRRHAAVRTILRWARCPVLAVAPDTTSIDRVVLTADFGGTSMQANSQACALAPNDKATQLVHVIPDGAVNAYLDAANELCTVTRAALPPKARHHTPVRFMVGSAVRVLRDMVRREAVDLIALGRHATPSDQGQEDA